jgi:hypothetical protein
MNEKLREINELYLQIWGSYMDISRDEWFNPSPEERAEFADYFEENSRIYNLVIEKFNALSPDLSPAEILEGYQQGCKLLQRNLSGDMCQNFDIAYIPTMIQAIKNNETHTAFMFLPVLADHMGKEIAPIVMEALDSESPLIRERALSVADHINLLVAAPKIRAMVNDVEPQVASLAGKIITSWDK